MKDDDILVDEESYYKAFDLFGTEYMCRILGSPLFVEMPDNIECPVCSKEMIYIAAPFVYGKYLKSNFCYRPLTLTFF